jgi:hypothetical protein
MDFSDLIKSGLGAVIGFMLAQVVSLSTFAASRIRRPRLGILSSQSQNWQILMHSVEAENGETYKEEEYGFYVCNRGRRIATEVQFQILSIECRGRNQSEFAEISRHTFDLEVYSGSNRRVGEKIVTLVPGAQVLIHLASWREDSNVVYPAVDAIPDYYEEICSHAIDYRFTIVSFDDSGMSTTSVASIKSAGVGRKSG